MKLRQNGFYLGGEKEVRQGREASWRISGFWRQEKVTFLLFNRVPRLLYIWGSGNISLSTGENGDLDKYTRILTVKNCVIILWNMNFFFFFFFFYKETCILILFQESYLICKNMIVWCDSFQWCCNDFFCIMVIVLAMKKIFKCSAVHSRTICNWMQLSLKQTVFLTCCFIVNMMFIYHLHYCSISI